MSDLYPQSITISYFGEDEELARDTAVALQDLLGRDRVRFNQIHVQGTLQPTHLHDWIVLLVSDRSWQRFNVEDLPTYTGYHRYGNNVLIVVDAKIAEKIFDRLNILF